MRSNTAYDEYMAKAFKWVILIITGACMCAAVTFSVLKILGYYQTVQWLTLAIFIATCAVYFIAGLVFIKKSTTDGALNKKIVAAGKIFIAVILIIQYNFIFYLIPSKEFWGYSTFFLMLVAFFLDRKLIAAVTGALTVSISVAFVLIGGSVLPVRDEYFVPEMTLLIICLALSFAAVYVIAAFLNSFLISKSNMLAYQNDKILKYLTQKEQSDEMIRVLSHDLKHHLQIWREAAIEGGAVETVKDIEAYAARLSEYDLIDVNNKTANAIINQKHLDCVKAGVTFTVKGGFESHLLLSKTDMAALLGNLLDNAFEAAVLVKDAPKISLTVKSEKHFLLLEINNSCLQEPLKKDGVFISSKPNRDSHGIGMISIERVLKSYNGVMRTEYSENVFSVSVMLRAYNGLN